jgi:two-component system chemotaxis response regulator CheB
VRSPTSRRLKALRKIRVLVADDSPTARDVIATLLALDPLIDVVGTATDGLDAVDKARALRPDVITMDALMPGLDGIGAIERILAEAPARILVVSAETEGSSDLSFRALAAGALEIVPKARAGVTPRAWGERLVQSIKLMSEVPVITRHRRAVGSAPVPPSRDALAVIGIVASTGGPPVVAKLLAGLPASASVLLAQHVAEGFAGGLVRWMACSCKLAVVTARAGASIEPGHVYVAPDGCDLEVASDGRLATPRSRGGHCPSGDLLLSSLARTFGARAAGVVLTGMGDDGALGLLALRQAGGRTFAQDEASSVVYGMPRAARHAVDAPTTVEEMIRALSR